MQIISLRPIGYQKSTDEDGNYIYQLRYVCKVKAFGEFKNDPDGDIVEIKLINPHTYKQYFDWGEIGERIMERAAQLKATI